MHSSSRWRRHYSEAELENLHDRHIFEISSDCRAVALFGSIFTTGCLGPFPFAHKAISSNVHQRQNHNLHSKVTSTSFELVREPFNSTVLRSYQLKFLTTILQSSKIKFVYLLFSFSSLLVLALWSTYIRLIWNQFNEETINLC